MKLKRLVALGATVLMLTGALTGCSKELENAQDNVNKAALDAIINNSQIVKQETSDEINNYIFSGADFVLNGEKYQLDVSGFATNTKNEKAYANLEYEVPASEFKDVDAKDSVEVLNAIAKVITEYEMKNFDYAPMKSLTSFNNAMNKTFESPIEGYKFSSGLTYAVEDITFNKQDGYVSFSTRQNVDYSKTTTRTVLMYTGKSMVPVVQTHTDHEKFNQEHQIYIKASPEEISAMQADKSLIFEKFVNLVNEGQKTDYTVRAGNIQNEKPFNDAPEYSL